MKNTLLLLLLAVSLLISHAQTVEVLWKPTLNRFQATSYQGVDLLADHDNGAFWPELVRAHVAGELTLYPGLSPDETPYPRHYRAFMRFFPDEQESHGWDPLPLMSNVADSLAYLAQSTYIPSWLIQETWAPSRQGLSCHFQMLHLLWEDPYGALGKVYMRTSLDFTSLPPAFFRYVTTPNTYAEELQLPDLYAHRRLSIEPVAWRPVEEATWRSLSGTNSQQQPDSLLRAMDYLSVIPKARQLRQWYPERSKSPYILHLHLPDEIGRENALTLPFSANEWEANYAFVDGLLPRIVADVMANRVLMVAPHSDTLMAPGQAEAILTEMYRLRLEVTQIEETMQEASDGNEEEDPFGEEEDSWGYEEEPALPTQDSLPMVALPEGYAVENIRIVQIKGRLTVDSGDRVSFSPHYLDLIWRDPMGKYPQFVWGCLPIETLTEAGYTLQGQPLGTWFAERSYAAYPVKVNDRNLSTMEEAWIYRQILESGQWELMPVINAQVEDEVWGAFKAGLPSHMLLEK